LLNAEHPNRILQSNARLGRCSGGMLVDHMPTSAALLYPRFGGRERFSMAHVTKPAHGACSRPCALPRAEKTAPAHCRTARKRTVILAALGNGVLNTRVRSKHALLLYWISLARTEADRLK
jgi:hypothetical protein